MTRHARQLAAAAAQYDHSSEDDAQREADQRELRQDTLANAPPPAMPDPHGAWADYVYDPGARDDRREFERQWDARLFATLDEGEEWPL